MKLFLFKIFTFILIGLCLSEILIRTYKLVPDIPERELDKYEIQKYIPGQSGFYTSSRKWAVNKYGWLGVSDINNDTIVSLIGDSFIENLMNPIECNQGNILKIYFPNYSFFEAARSGVTFIDALEISKSLELEINPKCQLLYLSNEDFFESIYEIKKLNDRGQISINKQQIINNKIKYHNLKKILYNVKVFYFIYLKSTAVLDNKTAVLDNKIITDKFNKIYFQKLFIFCNKNYNTKKLIFIFHPNTNQIFINFAKAYKIKYILLNSKEDNTWLLKNDYHWSCYGHKQVAYQIKKQLRNIIN